MSKAKRRTLPPQAPDRKDLIVLAADKNTAQSIEGLLSRSPALNIRTMTFEIIIHPGHDPGCFGQSAGLLAVYRKTHTHALVVFDREGCGQEDLVREDLEARVEQQLSATGLQSCSAIVIDPELERMGLESFAARCDGAWLGRHGD